MTKRRSAASLIASGIATISLHQHMAMPRILTTDEAFAADRKALRGDASRAMKRLDRERISA